MIRNGCEAIGKFCLKALEERPRLGVQRGVVEYHIRVVGEQRQDHGPSNALALVFFRDFDTAKSSVGFREYFEIDVCFTRPGASLGVGEPFGAGSFDGRVRPESQNVIARALVAFDNVFLAGVDEGGFPSSGASEKIEHVNWLLISRSAQ